MLHEVQLLHESDGFTTQSRNLDRYESIFDQLVQALRERGSAPKRGWHFTFLFLHQMHLCSGSLMV